MGETRPRAWKVCRRTPNSPRDEPIGANVSVVDEAGVVVIGSGAFGASTAYHLTAMGQEGGVVVDAHEIASQTSPRAAGLTKQVRPNPDGPHMALLRLQTSLRCTEETGQPASFGQPATASPARA